MLSDASDTPWKISKVALFYQDLKRGERPGLIDPHEAKGI